jgi:branched-subunit amino acid transport protein AzlD
VIGSSRAPRTGGSSRPYADATAGLDQTGPHTPGRSALLVDYLPRADFPCPPLRNSELIRFLGDHSPVGVMIALVGYTLRNVAWLDPAIALPILLSVTVTIGLQLWRSNLVLSLAGGTAVHVALATTIAGGFG